ncbi:uncharacterized protein TNCT_239591 [Trichonephila clavata]|uniref:Thyroglobulin type-1 domain-containing protein n=1 Tax=Trichonephila clavata TaxID=2740835 RepID=A0A8X6HX66_TRICU|nr:uncharacterized protein TNCT_239591 [Trichonephila clavata]
MIRTGILLVVVLGVLVQIVISHPSSEKNNLQKRTTQRDLDNTDISINATTAHPSSGKNNLQKGTTQKDLDNTDISINATTAHPSSEKYNLQRKTAQREDQNCTSGITPLGFMMEMEPKCDEKGKYLFMQCFKGSKFCACFSKRGFPITPPLSFLKSCKCLVKKNKKESSGMIGGYVPQCEEDGTFKKQQCHYSTGYCYCADPYTGKRTTKPSRDDPKCD